MSDEEEVNKKPKVDEEGEDEEELDTSSKKKSKPKKKSKKKQEDDDDEDDDEDEEEEEDDDDKKKKTSKKSGPKRDLKPGEVTMEIGSNRFVTVMKFKNQVLVDIREFYEKEGKLLPGKKGIALKKEQWKELLNVSAKITKALEDM